MKDIETRGMKDRETSGVKDIETSGVKDMKDTETSRETRGDERQRDKRE